MIGTEGKVQLSCGSGGKGVVLGPGEAFGEEAVSFGLSDEVKNSKKQLELSNVHRRVRRLGRVRIHTLALDHLVRYKNAAMMKVRGGGALGING